MKQMFIYNALFLVLLAVPNFVFADIGERPTPAEARKAYEDNMRSEVIHSALSRGLVRISKFEKTDGQSREVYGVKMYHMDVEIELEFLANASVCGNDIEGIMAIEPEAKYIGRMNNICSSRVLKTGSRITGIGSIEFEKTERKWKAGQGTFLAKKVEDSDAESVRFAINGDEVTDKKTGLIWRRCVEGMVYKSGTCTKTAKQFNYDEAMRHAAARHSGKVWRVPKMDELDSIVDPSFIRKVNPITGRTEIDPTKTEINPTVFPATPICGFWTDSPMPGESKYAWAISFGGAIETGYSGIEGQYCVRLVRSGQ